MGLKVNLTRWSRRAFLRASSGAVAAAGAAGGWFGQGEAAGQRLALAEPSAPAAGQNLTLFLCGDVMTGRGIDQILPYPSEPTLYESYLTSALEYVALAERANGPIPRPVPFSYAWGDALAELEARAPDQRIANLETTLTTSEEALPKGINYRMHPGNVPCLLAAQLDGCVLANNHILDLDWGVAGLRQTVETLRQAGVATTGAGQNDREAAQPALLQGAGKGQVLVFGFGSPTSGIPESWVAAEDRAGVQLLPDLSPRTASRVAEQLHAQRQLGDLVVASIHWGDNWGYPVPPAQREFAHRLIEAGSVDVVHGHSSHHPKGIEVYRERLILYGCGDFLNDYEGIGGHEAFRSELVLAYFATLEAVSGRLVGLAMVPFRIRRLRLERADRESATWLGQRLDREGRELGSGVALTADGVLTLCW